jgi:hypothetical protein
MDPMQSCRSELNRKERLAAGAAIGVPPLQKIVQDRQRISGEYFLFV